MVQKVRDDPEHLGCKSLSLSPSSFFARFSSHVLTIPFCVSISAVNCFQIDCLRRKYAAQTPAQGGPVGGSHLPSHKRGLATQ
jgi:hypothetical protein